MNAKTRYRVRPSQIVKKSRGWLTLKVKGAEIKVRASQVDLIEGSLANRRVGNRKYDCRKYTRTTSEAGNFTMNNGDVLANKLHGKTLDDVYKQAAKTLQEPEKDLRAKYEHLNFGMQRMCLGNRMRAEMGLNVRDEAEGEDDEAEAA